MLSKNRTPNLARSGLGVRCSLSEFPAATASSPPNPKKQRPPKNTTRLFFVVDEVIRENTCKRLQRLQVFKLVSAGRHRLVHLNVGGRRMLILQQHNLRLKGRLLLMVLLLLLLLLMLLVMVLELVLLVDGLRFEFHLVVLVHHRVAERVLQVGVAGRAVLVVLDVVVVLVFGAASDAAVQRRVRQIVVNGGLIDAHVAESAHAKKKESRFSD